MMTQKLFILIGLAVVGIAVLGTGTYIVLNQQNIVPFQNQFENMYKAPIDQPIQQNNHLTPKPPSSSLPACPANHKSSTSPCVCPNGSVPQGNCTTHAGENACYYGCP